MLYPYNPQWSYDSNIFVYSLVYVKVYIHHDPLFGAYYDQYIHQKKGTSPFYIYYKWEINYKLT